MVVERHIYLASQSKVFNAKRACVCLVIYREQIINQSLVVCFDFLNSDKLKKC